jgi:hypothetical protein
VRPDPEKFFTFIFKSTGPVNKPFHTCRSRVLSRRITPLLANPPPDPRNCAPFEYIPGLFSKTTHLFDRPLETISNSCRSICRHNLQESSKRKAYEAKLTKTYLSKKRQCLNLGGQHVYHHNPNLAPRAKRNRLVVDNEWRKRMRNRAVKGG